MKPGKHDIKVNILISGDELIQLKRHTWMMADAFGLDSRIEKYRGTKPIGLYQWDMDCLIDSIDSALEDERDYPDRNAPEYHSLKNLHHRLKEVYDLNYG